MMYRESDILVIIKTIPLQIILDLFSGFFGNKTRGKTKRINRVELYPFSIITSSDLKIFFS